jgi:secreted trypsin-like serine protease
LQDKFLCGGAIATQQHILTAAHCFNFSLDPTMYSTVHAGSLNKKGGSKYRVRMVNIHPKYDKGGEKLYKKCFDVG